MDPGTAEIFSVPPIISGTGKATQFKFCTHILSIDRKKPIINFGKSSYGRSQDSSIFSRAPIYWAHASRGRLCDSSAFL